MIPHVTDQTALISAVRFEYYNSEQIKKAELIGKHMVAERPFFYYIAPGFSTLNHF